MLKKLIPFLSLFLFAGVALATDGPPPAHDSYAPSAMASDSGHHAKHHKKHQRHKKHPH
jgi:hypothetical protein